MLYLAVLSSLVLAYAFSQVRFYAERRKLLRSGWEELLEQIAPVDVAGIAQIADCYLHPSSTQLRMEPIEMWEKVGKLEGLQVLRANAKAMLDLAVYAAQWNRVEGRIVGEMIRRDGVRLNRAITQIELAMLAQFRAGFVPFQLQEAAAAYHLMRERLLGLYEVAHVGLYPRLSEVV